MLNSVSCARVAGVLLCLGLASHSTIAEPQAARVIAAGGMITETIYALGQQARLVGVDSTSQFPPRQSGCTQMSGMSAHCLRKASCR